MLTGLRFRDETPLKLRVGLLSRQKGIPDVNGVSLIDIPGVTTTVAPSPVLPTPNSTAGRSECPLRLRDVVSKGVDVVGTHAY